MKVTEQQSLLALPLEPLLLRKPYQWETNGGSQGKLREHGGQLATLW